MNASPISDPDFYRATQQARTERFEKPKKQLRARRSVQKEREDR